MNDHVRETPSEKAIRFASDPTEFFDYSFTKMHSLERSEMEALQLAALKFRFEDLYQRVPMVKKLADKQKISSIDCLTDVIPLLFEHSMYKSYPPSLLENNRFEQLTKWLDKLTAHDLTVIDPTACTGIDDWVDLLDEKTPLKLIHSSGTSGVLSLLPLSKEEYRLGGKHWPMCFFQKYGDPAPTAENYIPNVDVIVPSYRYGASAFARGNDIYSEFFAGSEERLHTLYPGRISSDALYLTAKVASAKKKGELHKLKISPTLLARKEEFEKQQINAESKMEHFLDEMAEKLQGRRIYLNSIWTTLYEFAKRGHAKNLSKVFSPDSVVAYTGGTKGMTLPDDFEKKLCDFAGIDKLTRLYGMTEVLGAHPMCSEGKYHQAPHIIIFTLDPDTSEVLPREGTVTGRAAFYDLLSNSHWGGFISGDEITINWDCDCPCGAKTPYIDENIARYSEKRGGDDKITCTATPDAHQEAMDYLNSF